MRPQEGRPRPRGDGVALARAGCALAGGHRALWRALCAPAGAGRALAGTVSPSRGPDAPSRGAIAPSRGRVAPPRGRTEKSGIREPPAHPPGPLERGRAALRLSIRRRISSGPHASFLPGSGGFPSMSNPPALQTAAELMRQLGFRFPAAPALQPATVPRAPSRRYTAMAGPPMSPRTTEPRRMLHVTNGDVAAEVIRRSGVAGDRLDHGRRPARGPGSRRARRRSAGARYAPATSPRAAMTTTTPASPPSPAGTAPWRTTAPSTRSSSGSSTTCSTSSC